jgi:hypothetical protein
MFMFIIVIIFIVIIFQLQMYTILNYDSCLCCYYVGFFC